MCNLKFELSGEYCPREQNQHFCRSCRPPGALTGFCWPMEVIAALSRRVSLLLNKLAPISQNSPIGFSTFPMGIFQTHKLEVVSVKAVS